MNCGELYVVGCYINSTAASSYYLNVQRSDGSVFQDLSRVLFSCLTMQVLLRKSELINSPRKLGVYLQTLTIYSRL